MIVQHELTLKVVLQYNEDDPVIAHDRNASEFTAINMFLDNLPDYYKKVELRHAVVTEGMVDRDGVPLERKTGVDNS